MRMVYTYVCCRYGHPDPDVRAERIARAEYLATRIRAQSTADTQYVVVPWWDIVDPRVDDTPEVRTRGLYRNRELMRQIWRAAYQTGGDVLLVVDGEYPPTAGMRHEIDYWHRLATEWATPCGPGPQPRARDCRGPVLYLVDPHDGGGCRARR